MIVVDEMACARLNETINAMSIDLFFKDEHTHRICFATPNDNDDDNDFI